MAPGTSGGQQQHPGGKKTINKVVNTSKRKAAAAEEAQQRRAGCPILLESGCRIGEPVDPNNPGDAVRMICQNPKCEYSPFIHRRCYDEWEDVLVTVMATTSWSRSWTDAQRRSNLWDKKGYQLIGKMCRCLCDKGHVRRDLDYKPPIIEDPNAKKKIKKVQTSKHLPTLKNPDFKSGFIGKQLPNASSSGVPSTSTTSTTSAPGTYIVSRSAAAKRQMYHSYAKGSQSNRNYEYQRSLTPASSTLVNPEKTGGVIASQGIEISRRLNKYNEFSQPHHVVTRMPAVLQTTKDPSDGDDSELGEFENSIIPCVRSLLRWKNTPIQLNDCTLTDIVKNCSAETKKKISEDGGLGAALAKTGYFIVGADSLRLKENVSQLSDALPPLIRDAIHGGDEIAKDVSGTNLIQASKSDQQKPESNCSFVSMDPPFGEDRFASIHLPNQSAIQNMAGQILDANQFTSIAPASFTCQTSVDMIPVVDPVTARSPSSGFDEGSVGSLKSAHEIESLNNEMTNNQYFVSAQIPCREVMENGYWPTEAECEFMNRQLHFYNSSAGASARLIEQQAFPADFIRQFWQPNAVPPPQLQQAVWYFREYQLFNGPSLEDVFRRELPNLYNRPGRRFEATNVFTDSPVFPNAV